MTDHTEIRLVSSTENPEPVSLMLSLQTPRITVERDEPTHVVQFNVRSQQWMTAAMRATHAKLCVICAVSATDPTRAIQRHLNRCARDIGPSAMPEDFTLIESSIEMRPLTTSEQEDISGP